LTNIRASLWLRGNTTVVTLYSWGSSSCRFPVAVVDHDDAWRYRSRSASAIKSHCRLYCGPV
jgi:hypothetical protein